MKLKIFFSIVICSAMFLPSIDSRYDPALRTYYFGRVPDVQPQSNLNKQNEPRPRVNQQQSNPNQQQQHHPNQQQQHNSNQQQQHNPNQQQQHNPNQQQQRNLNQQQQRNLNQQPKQQKNLYCGYTIAAMIDDKLLKAAREIEKFIKQAPSLRRNFSPTAANDYHTTIYSIYDCQSMPAQQCDNDRVVSNKCWAPASLFENKNHRTTCYIESYWNGPLYIKYASLHIGANIITLTLDIENESWDSIQYARDAWERDYYGKALSSQAKSKLLYIEIAKGQRRTVALNDLNYLNELVRPFNGGKLKTPSVYLRDSHRYIPYQKKANCRT